MTFTSSHKYIKHISTCGTILTEYLLNARRRPQTPERARKSPTIVVELSTFPFIFVHFSSCILMLSY